MTSTVWLMAVPLAKKLISSIGSLFDVYPNISRFFGTGKDLEFTVQLASFYHHCLHRIHDKISDDANDIIEESDNQMAEFMTSRILLAKMNILSVIRTTVMTCILQPLLDDDQDQSSSSGCDYQEMFLHLNTGFLSESSFYQDYSARYPLNEDLEIFKHRGVIIDAMRIEYLRDGLETIKPVPKKHKGMNLVTKLILFLGSVQGCMGSKKLKFRNFLALNRLKVMNFFYFSCWSFG